MDKSFSLRFETLEVPATDLDVSSTWYQKVFGLEEAWSDDDHVLMTPDRFPELGFRLLLARTSAPTRLGFRSSATGIDHSFADIVVDDLKGYHSALKAAGIDVPELSPPSNDWAPHGFALLDPAGNRLAVFSYGQRSDAAE
ncbi:MAG: VOC family protein [Roseibium sp.]|uniref:VOC family protein n=1 Tax=Roseibium sp. TaxID=1936156 RepID=UPI0026176B5C|nr:VOC family protein [Roseibium sp.]MCV0426591.1 VOC family protein [Roseibium sp.]